MSVNIICIIISTNDGLEPSHMPAIQYKANDFTMVCSHVILGRP